MQATNIITVQQKKYIINAERFIEKIVQGPENKMNGGQHWGQLYLAKFSSLKTRRKNKRVSLCRD